MKKLAFCLLFISHIAHAELISLSSVVPTNWLLQNYFPGNVVLWFTGSPCSNGMLSLPTDATPADHARLYATVMSAKISSAKMFVIYDNATSGCLISSFGFS